MNDNEIPDSAGTNIPKKYQLAVDSDGSYNMTDEKESLAIESVRSSEEMDHSKTISVLAEDLGRMVEVKLRRQKSGFNPEDLTGCNFANTLLRYFLSLEDGADADDLKKLKITLQRELINSGRIGKLIASTGKSVSEINLLVASEIEKHFIGAAAVYNYIGQIEADETVGHSEMVTNFGTNDLLDARYGIDLVGVTNEYNGTTTRIDLVQVKTASSGNIEEEAMKTHRSHKEFVGHMLDKDVVERNQRVNYMRDKRIELLASPFAGGISSKEVMDDIGIQNVLEQVCYWAELSASVEDIPSYVEDAQYVQGGVDESDKVKRLRIALLELAVPAKSKRFASILRVKFGEQGMGGDLEIQDKASSAVRTLRVWADQYLATEVTDDEIKDRTQEFELDQGLLAKEQVPVHSIHYSAEGETRDTIIYEPEIV